MEALLGVGGPNLASSGGGWDPAPLLVAGVFAMLLLGAGARRRPLTLVGCLVAGIAVDLVSDALSMFPVLILAPVVLVLALVALRGTTVP